jgi:hypothetical protein
LYVLNIEAVFVAEEVFIINALKGAPSFCSLLSWTPSRDVALRRRSPSWAIVEPRSRLATSGLFLAGDSGSSYCNKLPRCSEIEQTLFTRYAFQYLSLSKLPVNRVLTGSVPYGIGFAKGYR